MRILVLTNLFPTPWDPMRGTFNRQQFQRLGRKHEVTVMAAVDFRNRLVGKRGRVEIPGLSTDYFTFVYPPRLGRSLHAWCWYLSLRLQRGAALQQGAWDCLLASWAYPDAVGASRLAARLGIPCVVKVHGSDLNVQAEFALRRCQIKSTLRRADAVVAVSRALADKAVEIGAAPARTRVIYNGVDTTLFAPGSRSAARRRLGLPDGSPLLLYVGNLKASKGCLDLLAAFPELLTRHPDARLVYVGAGPYRARLLERAAAPDCDGRVRLVGAVAHDALADWFSAADLLCLPSYNEGVPNVILESMACGTPVVATSVGGIPEVVPEYAGVLVPAHDGAALVTALDQAAGHAWDTSRIAAHAAGFRWEDNIDQLEQLIATACAQSLPRRCGDTAERDGPGPGRP